MNYDDWEKSQIRNAALLAADGSKSILRDLETLLHGNGASMDWSMGLADYWTHYYGNPDKAIYDAVLDQYGVDDAGFWETEVGDEDDDEE